MKFKVGDKVRILSAPFGLDGSNKNLIGKTVTLIDVSDGLATFMFGGFRYYWFLNRFEPIVDQKILITTDGKETKARLYDDKKVVKESVAKCSPKDEFDFETGAKIAFERLVGNQEKTKQKFKIGDYVIGNKKANKYAYTTEGWLGVMRF